MQAKETRSDEQIFDLRTEINFPDQKPKVPDSERVGKLDMKGIQIQYQSIVAKLH